MGLIDPRTARRRASQMRRELAGFLRDIISIPSESGREDKVARRIQLEMDRLGFDKSWLDPLGNVIGQVGKGKRVIVFDSHIDTVGVGDPRAWAYDPFDGDERGGVVYGRGAADDKGGLVAQLFGAANAQRMGLPPDVSVVVIGTVQEEDCDGLALGWALEQSIPKAECVVLGEATGLDIYRGQRGRMEIAVHTTGKACHASAPERGVNAVYAAAPIIQAVEKLGRQLAGDPFLGQGTVAVTKIECRTGSLNTIPDRATLYLDRRLTAGETRESALEEIARVAGPEAEVEVLNYEALSHTGWKCSQEKYFPSWVLPEEHALVQAGQATREMLMPARPSGKWIFSTNGVASMGKFGIPTIGLGPGFEVHAHTVEDQIKVEDLEVAATFYSLFPTIYAAKTTRLQMRRLKVK